MRPMPGGYRERVGEFDQRADNARQLGRDSPLLLGGKMFGVWIAVNSTWANRLWFKPNETDAVTRQPDGKLVMTSAGPQSVGIMRIEFVSGAICRYDNYPAANFLDLASSSSKGRWILDQLKKKKVPYVLESGPTRSKEEVKRLVAARQPVSAYQKRRFFNVGGKAQAGGGTPS